MRMTNITPMIINNGVSMVTEFTDNNDNKFYIQYFNISTKFEQMYLREYTDIKAIYHFINLYKTHIIIPKDILKDKLRKTKFIYFLENENNYVLIHKDFYFKNYLEKIFLKK